MSAWREKGKKTQGFLNSIEMKGKSNQAAATIILLSVVWLVSKKRNSKSIITQINFIASQNQ